MEATTKEHTMTTDTHSPDEHIAHTMGDTPTVWVLANYAEVSDPDSTTSPGAVWLRSVRDAFVEALKQADEGSYLTDIITEVADNCVPIYTHEMWRIFVDLGAYSVDISEYYSSPDHFDGSDPAQMTKMAQTALYAAARMLCAGLAFCDDVTIPEGVED
jgi:hypothetical protein